MYTPSQFKETDVALLHEQIRANPLGTLVTSGSHGIEANHLPLLLNTSGEGGDVLAGHIARANNIRETISSGSEVLCIFQGVNAYISPQWYASKQVHGKVVPTWNYVAVHAYGCIRFIEDKAWLKSHLELLTHAHEATQYKPWKMSDAPLDFIEQLMESIVGVEIRISRLLGKWKVSQNRSVADRMSVARALEERQAEEMAKLVSGGL